MTVNDFARLFALVTRNS